MTVIIIIMSQYNLHTVKNNLNVLGSTKVDLLQSCLTRADTSNNIIQHCQCENCNFNSKSQAIVHILPLVMVSINGRKEVKVKLNLVH